VSGFVSAWVSLWSEITKAAWVANVLGSMIGVAIGAFVAVFVLRRQLKHDRDLFAEQSRNDRELFERSLMAEHDKERRDRRRAVAIELANELQPAGDRLERLTSFEGLDVSQAVWPDYEFCFEAVRRLQVLLYVNDLLNLWEDTISVLNLCHTVWGTTYRTVQQCIDEDPAEYHTQDPRIRAAFYIAAFMTSRKSLQSLVTTLLAWSGEGPLSFPPIVPIEELNRISSMVRERMREPLTELEWNLILKNQLNSGEITKEQFDARMTQIYLTEEGE
jgi:hypothetical protein